jgi:hypothetical protein
MYCFSVGFAILNFELIFNRVFLWEFFCHLWISSQFTFAKCYRGIRSLDHSLCTLPTTWGAPRPLSIEIWTSDYSEDSTGPPLQILKMSFLCFLFYFISWPNAQAKRTNELPCHQWLWRAAASASAHRTLVLVAPCWWPLSISLSSFHAHPFT